MKKCKEPCSHIPTSWMTRAPADRWAPSLPASACHSADIVMNYLCATGNTKVNRTFSFPSRGLSLLTSVFFPVPSPKQQTLDPPHLEAPSIFLDTSVSGRGSESGLGAEGQGNWTCGALQKQELMACGPPDNFSVTVSSLHGDIHPWCLWPP